MYIINDRLKLQCCGRQSVSINSGRRNVKLTHLTGHLQFNSAPLSVHLAQINLLHLSSFYSLRRNPAVLLLFEIIFTYLFFREILKLSLGCQSTATKFSFCITYNNDHGENVVLVYTLGSVLFFWFFRRVHLMKAYWHRDLKQTRHTPCCFSHILTYLTQHVYPSSPPMMPSGTKMPHIHPDRYSRVIPTAQRSKKRGTICLLRICCRF